MAELTNKQKVFCEEYAIDFNGSRAAVAAGYSKNSCRTIAAENLAKPNIQKYLAEITAGRAAERKYKAEDMFNDLLEIVQAEVGEEFDEDGREVPVIRRSENFRNALQKHGQFGMKEKLKALELIGRHLGAFTDTVELSGKEGTCLPIKIVK